MMLNIGSVPQPDTPLERGLSSKNSSLESILASINRPVVVFPECTTSNNVSILYLLGLSVHLMFEPSASSVTLL